MTVRLPAVLAAALLAGCSTPAPLTRVDTRTENVAHQRLAAEGGGGTGAVQPYALQSTEGYRMPQLYAAPDPVLGDRDPRRELAPTTVCVQVVVNAEGAVERSVPLLDRSDCAAGSAPENHPLMQAVQDAVAAWRYSPAAVCHFAAGQVPTDRGDCRAAERVEPVAVSLFYAFTFQIVHGQHTVQRR